MEDDILMPLSVEEMIELEAEYEERYAEEVESFRFRSVFDNTDQEIPF